MSERLTELPKVTSTSDNTLFYGVDQDRTFGNQSFRIEKLDFINDLGIVTQLIVESTTDLAPYLSGDEYILPSGLVMVNGTINLGDKAIRISTNTVLRGLANGTFISTNANGVVRATNVASAVIIREVNVVASAGACFVLTGGAQYQLNLFFVGMFGAKAAIINGFNVQSVKQCYIEAADGITFDGTTNKVFVSESPFYSITGSAMTFASSLVCSVADIVTSFFKFDSPGVGITAEGGYTINEGKVRGSLIDGTAIPLSGLAASDLNWTMTDNSGIADSRIVGGFYLDTAVETTFSAVNTPTKVQGTTLGFSLNERFTSATSGRLTYVGLQPAVLDVSCIFAVGLDNNVILEFFLAKNGTVLQETRSRVPVGSGNSQRNGTINGIIDVVTGDYIEAFVSNVGATSPMTAISFNLKSIG